VVQQTDISKLGGVPAWPFHMQTRRTEQGKRNASYKQLASFALISSVHTPRASIAMSYF